MLSSWNDIHTWLVSPQGSLALPLALALWIAWGDIKTQRIPNYLTLTTAVAGLAYGLIFSGGNGLLDGVLGMLLGFAFLILPYIWGGMGAGDVKAFAALGAWLGVWRTLMLFCYMGMAGGLMALATLWWRGLLWQKLRNAWVSLLNLVLSRSASGIAAAPTPKTPGIPYGVAMALGMATLLILGG